MKRITYVLATIIFMAVPAFARPLSAAADNQLSMLVYITLAIALVALIIAVITIFWILKVKKVQDVALMNYKDDMVLTMNGLKGNLSRELKNVKRELTKTKPVQKQDQRTEQRPNHPENVPHKKPVEATKEAETDENGQLKKKPQKRRYYNKRRPSKKPDQGTSQQSE
ncbi:MAG: hypothetical protein CVU09_12470 [Bacteroidetes bacterium HGW-Bacteroidetes-4]|jgi:hypothetical protein|nr:MAG: hypothetical protein CVU09_12470 [Bacteroidetes bacterium HGW-Bacteroidetes-4]